MNFTRLVDLLVSSGYNIPSTPSIVLKGSGKKYKSSQFVISADVQRDADVKRAVNKIAGNFSESKMKIPSVYSDIDPDTNEEILWVYDGQHTVLAMLFLGLQELPAYVIPFESTTEQDKIKEMYHSFIGLNTSQVKVSWFDIHKGNVAVGDSRAVEIQSLCDSTGVTLCKTATRNTPNALSQIKVAYLVHGQFKEYMEESLRDLVSIWPNLKISGSVFHGYTRLLRELYKAHGNRNAIPLSTITSVMKSMNIADSLHLWDIAKSDYIKSGRVKPYLVGVAGKDTAASLLMMVNDTTNSKIHIRDLGVM